MEANSLIKLQASLADAIEQWISEQDGTNEWEALDTYVSDHTAELMASCAFNVLLAQKDLTAYYSHEKMFKNEASQE
jgi:hypothetical protein